MKILMIGLAGLCFTLQVQSQVYKPFSEAEKAIHALDNASNRYDSLRKIYKNRWSIGVTYGQRFIENGNKTVLPDTITFTDFTEKKAYFGVEGSYFVSQKVQVFLVINALFLPKEQNINSISLGSNGLQIDGNGNGGAMLNAGIGSRYLFLENASWRPYVGMQLGNIRVVARGGSISTLRNQNIQLAELTKSYGYGNLTVGLNHRIAPRSMLDINIGYLKANRTDSIGGIVSPGGITTSLSLHIVINARKN